MTNRLKPVYVIPGLMIFIALWRFLFLLVEYANRWQVTDFAVYYWAAYFWRTGNPLYTGLPAHPAMPPIFVYAYPPTLVVLLTPLTLLPYEVAWWLWSLASLAGVLAALWLLLTGLGFRGGWRLALFAGCLWFPPVHYAAMFQNVQTWVFASLVLAWWLTRRPGSGRAALAGLLIGLLGGIKLYPALMLVPLLLNRRQRVPALAGALGGLLFACGLSSLAANEWSAFVRVLAGESARWAAAPVKASVWGLCYWLGAEMGGAVALTLTVLLVAGAIVLTWYAFRRVPENQAAGSLLCHDAVWALWFVTLLLTTTAVVAVYYLLLALPPLLILFRSVWRATTSDRSLQAFRISSRRSSRVVRGVLVVAILLSIPPAVEGWPEWTLGLLALAQAVGLWVLWGLATIELYTLGTHGGSKDELAH